MTSPGPVAFTVFNFDVMWYGVLIAIGMVLATIISCKRAPLHDMTSDSVLDFIIICIPMGVIGARAYYLLFNWEDYTGDFYSIINIRGGGLAIHGGLILGILTALVICHFRRVAPLNLLDLLIPSVALAQSIGRWGNFFNSEAHGSATDLPWAVIVNGQAVHPTFLYESVWCLLLFFFLIFVDNRRKFQGQVFLLYGMLYSLERFFVEWLRTDSLMIGMFKQAQVLSCIVFVVCLIAYIILNKRGKKQGKDFYRFYAI